MTPPTVLVRFFALTALLLTLPASLVAGPPFPEFVDPHPNPGNDFGNDVVALSTGNVVITSPGDDAGGSNAGAVYLFNGATGALISTLTGSNEFGFVDITVTALTNGNYVLGIPYWTNGAVPGAGAATWGSGITGVSGVVSSSNSLVGSSTADNVGTTVTALTNGNYVVASEDWDNGLVVDAGAVTWCDGATGRTGAVTSGNSLVGSTANDGVGTSVTSLTNGNYVVCSKFWDHGAATNAGAATWGSGTTGITGAVSSSNSLVGSVAFDLVGNGGVTALANGNYVVRSTSWNHGSVTGVGAATWGDGSTGIRGAVSASNSLIGSTFNEVVGGSGVFALTNGNYVVCSPGWNDGAVSNVGAVTWGNGATGITGTVGTGNSLVGSNADDLVGSGGATALSNGHYVVVSPLWSNGAVRSVGAVTWGDGATGIIGTVGTGNSLFGTRANDNVGRTGVTALTNGHYVVRSQFWDSGVATDVGAVTWGDGTTGATGAVSGSNSLIGSTAYDWVGTTGVTPLANGNYVVLSADWDNGSANEAGAVTWGDGVSGVVGEISPSNSLVGGRSNDRVGFDGVAALTNGNYVVVSRTWQSDATSSVGAATWGDGSTGITGLVSPGNSLVGGMAGDFVGDLGVTALSNGNYVVGSRSWDDGETPNAGALTWGNGTTGTSGVVSNRNSLVGLQGHTNLQAVEVDDVNQTYFARFRFEDGGKVRLGSHVDGLTTVSVMATTATAVEGGGTGLYTFSRTGNAIGALTVGFQLDAAGTAAAATDFTLASTGTLTFDTGTGAGTIVIPDGRSSATVTLTAHAEATTTAEGPETAVLEVVAGNGYVVSPAPGDAATVTITGNGFSVTTTADIGEGSLRQAIENANVLGGNPTITFDGAVYSDATADVITLGGTGLVMRTPVTIDGPGARRLTISGDDTSPIFAVSYAGAVSLRGMTLAEGYAFDPANGAGAAIYCSGPSSVLSIEGCLITDNHSNQDAGAIAIYDSATVTIRDSTISGNSDSGGGISAGGILNFATLTLVNSTVSGNETSSTASTQAAGGIVSFGSLAVLNSTISGNEAPMDGPAGGIRFIGGSLTMHHSIVAGNVSGPAPTPSDITGTPTPLTATYNLIGDAATSGGITDGTSGNLVGVTDPLMGPLRDNGGPTPTHALVVGSPAIDAGDPLFAALVFDQRGFARILKGDATSLAATIDIGAYELFPAPTFTTGTVNVSGDPVNLAQASGAIPPGGVFSGPGVSGGRFYPTGLVPGLYRVTYTVTDAYGVTNASEVEVRVNEADLSLVLELRGLRRFKPTEVGKTGRAQRLTIRNIGLTEVKGLSLLVTGPADRDFRVTGPALRTLKPGDSTTATIEFRAGDEGRRTATLHVLTSDAKVSIEALLSGRGKKSGQRPPRAVN